MVAAGPGKSHFFAGLAIEGALLNPGQRGVWHS